MTKSLPEKDLTVIRPLAEELRSIAALPVHQQKVKLWKSVNALQKVRPMVCISQIPWHEIGIEKQLRCTDPLTRQIENELRMTLCMWHNMPTDMVIGGTWYCPLAVKDSGFGMDAAGESAESQIAGAVASRHYEPQIKEEKDIEKIQFPQVELDAAETDRRFNILQEIFAGILPVEKRGTPGFWFAPWDELITWWGVQEALMDLAMRPEMVKQAMDRLVNAYLHRLDQYEKLNLLALNNDNCHIGSGGFGFTDQLPGTDFDSTHIRASNLWGCGAAQIFSEVSPQMHKEFALDFELRWLSRFGLNYYGCCEQLHKKIDILRAIPRLRKISVSPWANLESAAQQIGADYVISHKPNPAIFAEDVWDLKGAEQQLRRAFEITRGCRVEIVMKDISTVLGQPQRLYQWAQMASRVAGEF